MTTRWLEQFVTRLEKAGFKPYQPRVPAGNRDGGQWSSTGTSRLGPTSQRARSINRTTRPKPIKKPKPITRLPSGKPITPRFQKPIAVSQAELDRLQAIDKPLERVYLFESIAVLGALGPLLPYATRQVAAVVSGALKEAQSTIRIRLAARAIRKFLGGKPDILGRNANGDIYMIKGNKKVRFNIANSHGQQPHYHLEEGILNSRGKYDWLDAVKHLGKDGHILKFRSK